MNHRIAPPQPFAPVDSTETATALARGSAWAFWIWAAVGLMQAGLIWFQGDAAHQDVRGATTGFMIFFAGFAAVLGWMQHRKPNRILPVFGLAWALYELSALSVGLMVGAPMAAPGLPGWSIALAAAAMVLCLLLHIGGLRGATGMARFTSANRA